MKIQSLSFAIFCGLLCLAAHVFVSCAPAPKALVVAPSAVPSAPSVAPVAESVRADVAAGGAVSARLEGQVAGLQKSAANLRDGMEKSLAEVERLRTAKAATEAELDALWKMMADSNERVRNLFAEAEAARASADEQRDLRAKAEKSLMDLARVSSLKDAEVTSLRAQRDDMAAALQASARNQQSLEQRLRSAERNAALGSWVRSMGWTALGAVILISGLYVFLRLRP